MRNSTSINIFKKSLLQFARSSPKSLFNCHSPKGIKYEIRSRLGLSHLREHKFKYSFQDTLNPFCDCGCEIETTAHFPLHCPQFYTERNTLSTKSKASILLYEIKITQILLKYLFSKILLIVQQSTHQYYYYYYYYYYYHYYYYCYYYYYYKYYY